MGLFGGKSDQEKPEPICELISSSGWRSQVYPDRFQLTTTALTPGGVVVVTVTIDRKTGSARSKAHWKSDPKARHGPSVPRLNKSVRIRITTGKKRQNKTLTF